MKIYRPFLYIFPIPKPVLSLNPYCERVTQIPQTPLPTKTNPNNINKLVTITINRTTTLYHSLPKKNNHPKLELKPDIVIIN